MGSTVGAPAGATTTRSRISAAWVVLLVAAAIGLAAAFLAQRYLRTQVDEINARAQFETVPLVVASSALGKGTHLTEANVAIRPVPREWAHSNAITPEQFEQLQFERPDSAVLAFPARVGEPIVWAQLESDKAPTFSARLASGRRAVTVPIDEVSSISGMVQPGDLIDLMLTIRRGARDLTFVLQQSVPVLATGTQVEQGQTSEAGRRSFTTLTLDTTPEDAKRVIAAREVGKLTALLRAPGDRAQVSEARDDVITLLGLAPPLRHASPLVPIIYGGAPLRDVPRLPMAAAPAASPTAAAPAAAAPGAAKTDKPKAAWPAAALAASDRGLAFDR